jgi:hypothetical protein
LTIAVIGVRAYLASRTESATLLGVPILDRHRDLRRRAIGLVDEELDRLRASTPEALRELSARSPIDRERGGLAVTTRIAPEVERVLVLVEVWRKRRVLATGGFAMHPDGTTHTPH